MNTIKFRSRFALFELLLCIAIISLLAAIAIPKAQAQQLYTNLSTGQIYQIVPVTNGLNGASVSNPALVAFPVSAAVASDTPARTSPAAPPVISPTGILGLAQSYLLVNDPTCNVWTNDYFMLWQGAVFANVKGVAGASAIGNDLGLELPIHAYNLHIDSVTRFEQLFGDVGSQSIGLGYDYAIHQIHASFGVDVRDTFANTAIRAVVFLEFAKASTSLAGASPFFRVQGVLQKNDVLEAVVGVSLPVGPTL